MRVILSATACAALVLACNLPLTNDTPDDGGDNTPGDGQTSPLDSLFPPATTAREPAPVQAAGTTALLNEVSFLPAQDSFQFVEIRAGAAGVDLSALRLVTESGDACELPAGAGALSAGELALILFDGLNIVDGTVIHADRTGFLATDQGTLTLADDAGTELDRVTWGDEAAEAIPYGRTGVPLELEAGMSIGRLPQSVDVSPEAWVVYVREQITPGGPNFNPGVDILFPMNGTLINSGAIDLSWYPVPNATAYMVQLADHAEMDALLVDQMVTEPLLTTPPLAEGTYYWRVQALFADGSAADFSRIHQFTLDDTVDLSEEEPASKSAVTRKGTRPVATLAVPAFAQRKDTPMILLESMSEAAGHGFDEPHAALSVSDPADYCNCSIACVAMINHFFGGSLTQDWIGYQLHRGDQPGPERDLNYGKGNWVDGILGTALGLGSPVNRQAFVSAAQLWADVKADISAGRPLILVERIGAGTHAIVVVGYDERYGKDFLVVNNPWNPNSASAARGLRDVAIIPANSYYRLPAVTLKGMAGDPSINLDSDGDKVCDFDEANRFGTKTGDQDTDHDCIHDREEIKFSMLAEAHGWARYVNKKSSDGHARTRPLSLAGDVPTAGRPELDVDADGGHLPDFVEELNRNGKVDTSLGETSPYDDKDDTRKVKGTIDEVVNVVEDRSSFANYAYNHVARNTRTHVELDLATDSHGKLKGTAKVKMTESGYFEFRQATTCGTTLYRVTTPDREWTVNIADGEFFCEDKPSEGPSVAISGGGTPDGSEVPLFTIYNEDCNVHDLTIGPSVGPTWHGFYIPGIKGSPHDQKTNHPLQPRETGERYTEVHITLSR